MTGTVMFAGAKGGVGVSTAAAMAAMQLSGPSAPHRTVAVIDAHGDLADMFGCEPAAGGLGSHSGIDEVIEALTPLTETLPEVALITPRQVPAPAGFPPPLRPEVVGHLCAVLNSEGIPAVVDAGRVEGHLAGGMADQGTVIGGRVLVAANDPVALQRAHSWRHWADHGVVLVHQPAWKLTVAECASIAGPFTATLRHAPQVAEFFHAGGMVPPGPHLHREMQALEGLAAAWGLAAEVDHGVSVAD